MALDEADIGEGDNLACVPDEEVTDEAGMEVDIEIQDTVTPAPKDGNTLTDAVIEEENVSDGNQDFLHIPVDDDFDDEIDVEFDVRRNWIQIH